MRLQLGLGSLSYWNKYMKNPLSVQRRLLSTIRVCPVAQVCRVKRIIDRLTVKCSQVENTVKYFNFKLIYLKKKQKT